MNTWTHVALVSMLVGVAAMAACKTDETSDPPVQTPDPECGNGLLEAGETCEGSPPPQGCDAASCVVESGYECSPTPPPPVAGVGTDDGAGTGAAEAPQWSSTCTLLPVCGNGIIEDGESCDDADTAPGDGCDPDCAVEEGFSCDGEPSECAACGDGFVDPGEACDAGALLGSSNPGCTDGCEVVDGWECFNQPSMCGPVCGDGMLLNTTVEGVTQGFAEDCDDGNTRSGDGCNATCGVEDGCTCTFQAFETSSCSCGGNTGSSSGGGSGSSGSGSSGSGSGTTGGSSGGSAGSTAG